ncbi:hypothetical protein ACTD5D_19005 [Nocardia takedensis]|uniref:hypothetical protein n=1 Tax=Nocardia takedensis TaxID=259390 RepID=UPI0002ED5FB7|nr:hypothetical protein [Nocardia takedensis]
MTASEGLETGVVNSSQRLVPLGVEPAGRSDSPIGSRLPGVRADRIGAGAA